MPTALYPLFSVTLKKEQYYTIAVKVFNNKYFVTYSATSLKKIQF